MEVADGTKLENKNLSVHYGVHTGRSLKTYPTYAALSSTLWDAVEKVGFSAIRSHRRNCFYFRAYKYLYRNAESPKKYAAAQIAILRVFHTSKNKSEHRSILDLGYKEHRWDLGPLIDEIAQKLYIGFRRDEENSSQSLTIHQYRLVIGPEDDLGNLRLSVKNKPTILAVRFDSAAVGRIMGTFIWPDDGTLLVYGSVSDNCDGCNEEQIKLAWLELKKKSDRVLFAIEIDLQNVSMDTQAIKCFSIISQTTSVSLVFCSAFVPEMAPEWQVVSLKRVTGEQKFECSSLFQIPSDELFVKFPLPQHTEMFSSTAVLGKYLGAWLIAFASAQPYKAYLLAFRNGRYGATLCELKVPRRQKVLPFLKSPFEMFSTTIVLTEKPNTHTMGIRKIDLTEEKCARQLKMYRFCAKCGKQEQRKRRNNKRERIANFKVCRQCKKLKFHLEWQCYPCHYCSSECQKDDWPTHKLIHSGYIRKKLTPAS